MIAIRARGVVPFAGHREQPRAARQGRPSGWSRTLLLVAAFAAWGCSATLNVAEVTRTGVAVSGEIPIEGDDIVVGGREALVTVVAFIDHGRAAFEPERLRREHAGDVRYVFKHFPQCAWTFSNAAAKAAEAVFSIAGAQAFFNFRFQLLEYREQMNAPLLSALAVDAGLPRDRLGELANPAFALRIERDVALGRSLGLDVVPEDLDVYFVNGALHAGEDRLEELVDSELAQARALQEKGSSYEEIYQTRVAENAKQRRDALAQLLPATLHYRVPVEDSPTLGPSDAPVTLVEFLSFTAGCERAMQPVNDQLRARYGDRLRIVFKHEHSRYVDRRAANLAEYAREVGGDAGFFDAARLLWQAPDLEDATLERIAWELGLDARTVLRAIDADRYAERIERDFGLARELRIATGSQPSVLLVINGRRHAKFADLGSLNATIDGELANAAQQLANGTPSNELYERRLQAIPAPVTHRPSEHPDDLPSRGPRHAPITVQAFFTYPGPGCRFPPAVHRLLIDNPGLIRFVVLPVTRPEPESSDRNLERTELALEVFAQLGNGGFWAANEFLCRPFPAPELWRVGLDQERAASALEAHRHGSRIEASAARAKQLGIEQHPAFLVNGRVLNYASLVPYLRQLVRERQQPNEGQPGSQPPPHHDIEPASSRKPGAPT